MPTMTKDSLFRTAKATFIALAACTLGLGQAHPASADLMGAYMEHQVFATSLAGHLAKIRFDSQALAESRSIYIYTPPGYNANNPKPYPVMVLLHGSPGQPLDWLYKGNAHKTMDDAIKAGRFPATVVVVVDGHGPFYKGGSEWADSVDGRCRMETAIAQDLPKFLKAHYRVSSDPTEWAIGGLSEGGYGAANIVVHHPDVYRNALVFSGDFAVSDDWPDANDVFGTDPANRLKNSPLYQLRHLSPEVRRSLHFYVAVGADDDSDLVTENESFVATCKGLGVSVRYDRDPGKHKWGFWSAHFQTALTPLAAWFHDGHAG